MRLKSLFLALFAMVLLVSCERVAPNYQGVLMQDFGKNGKSDFTLVKGRVSTFAPGTELFQVPLFIQRADFENQQTLKASDNTEFYTKPKYSYVAIESRAVDLVFQNKQVGAGKSFMKALEDNILEPKIFDIVDEASKGYSTEALMTTGGSLKFEKHVEDIVRKEFEKSGLKLENFALKLNFSDKVKNKIDNRNEVNTNLSVLDQQIEEQKKTNQLEELRTEYALIRSRGLTPQIMEEKKVNKWNGVVSSTYLGNGRDFSFVLPTSK